VVPLLHLAQSDGDRPLPFVSGPSLLDVLRDHRVATTSTCGGAGTCGACRVHVRGTCDREPNDIERRHLSADDVRAGIRLACQMHPTDDLRIDIERPPTAGGWHAQPIDDGAAASHPWPSSGWNPRAPLGVAIDVGTTHLRVSIWDGSTLRPVAAVNGLNPQLAYGADVLVRVATAVASAARARDLRDLVRGAIGDALRWFAAHHDIDRSRIGRVVLVGNTGMLMLAAGLDAAPLLDPDNWERPLDCALLDVDACRQSWGIAADAAIVVAPPLGGFVGSDLAAAVLATSLCEGTARALLIDFGTNSEVALWDGRCLWASSAAGGPAFEGCGLTSGMAAGPGAIGHVRLTSRDPLTFECEVIGGGAALGLAGSGAVDLIATLVDAGLITPTGLFTTGVPDPILLTAGTAHAVRLHRRDVDVVQRAKAAIGAAIESVLALATLAWQDLDRACVCGAFGDWLDIPHAQRIGLLPPVDGGRIERHGGAALRGCERLLLSESPQTALSDISRLACVLNLAGDQAYDGRYADHLRLRPMCGEEVRRC
jgi:uncharacterized 2Fe-2S/4Fe-4S cluster protein (DUF4445 family)